MIMEFDISKMVEEIVLQAKENQEEFIFETIYPYCENILQIKINKEELKQILLNGTQKQQPSEDCISRAKALEMLGDVPENWTDTEKEIQEVNDYRWFKSILEELPPVTPQPFINKPCVSEGVCREDKIQVLDKIRAEIIELRSRQNVGVLECLDIIDKYRAESEE